MIGEKWIRFRVDGIGMIKIDFSKGEITQETKNIKMLVKAKEWIHNHFDVIYDAEKEVWIGQEEKVKKEIENKAEYFGKYLDCKGLKNRRRIIMLLESNSQKKKKIPIPTVLH